MYITLSILVLFFGVVLWAYFSKKIGVRTTVVLIAAGMLLSQLTTIGRFVQDQKNATLFRQNIQKAIDKVNEHEVPPSSPIPKTIVQVWVQKDGGPSQIPADQIQFMKTMKEMHPNYNHLFFESDDVIEFLQKNYPEYLTTYNRLPMFIQKLDFFRYLAIYHYGGFYFDLDIEPKIPLDDSVRNHSAVFPVDEYLNAQSCAHGRMEDICMQGQNFLLGQYAFGAVAKHPFIKELVDGIHRNIDMYITAAKQMRTPSEKHNFVFKTTGPDFVTQCYVDSSPSEKTNVFILSNGERQVFGNYAIHQYAGLWK